MHYLLPVESPEGGLLPTGKMQWGEIHIYNKGVPKRFGFDVLELRNFKLLVKNKATGTPLRVYYILYSLAMDYCVLWLSGASLYLHLRGAFVRCSFRLIGQCESPTSWNELKELAPRFCVCMVTE